MVKSYTQTIRLALNVITRIFPTRYLPLNEIDLGEGLIVRPIPKTVELSRLNSKSYLRGIQVEISKGNQDLEMQLLRSWLLFHSFVMNEYFSIQLFQENDSAIKQVDQPGHGDPLDYENIIDKMFFASFPKNMTLSYLGLWEKYKQHEENDFMRNLMRNATVDIVPSMSQPQYAVIDLRYWQLMIYYSAIDAIIGTQPFCSEQHECLSCKKKNIPHKQKSGSAWLKERLTQIMGNDKKVAIYFDLIGTVHNLVRNKTVHESLFPTALPYHSDQSEVFDVTRGIDEFLHNDTALEQLVMATKEVTRCLVANEVLGTGIFLNPPPLHIEVVGFAKLHLNAQGTL